LLKIDFFSIIVSDVTVTIGSSNILRCCEVWCSRRGRWWRGRPTNRLDRHTDWTDRLRTWLATRRLLSRNMKLCRLVI